MSGNTTAPRSLIGEGQIFPDAVQAEEINSYATDYRVQTGEALHKRACEAHRSIEQGGFYGLGKAVTCIGLSAAYWAVKAISPDPPTTMSGKPW